MAQLPAAAARASSLLCSSSGRAAATISSSLASTLTPHLGPSPGGASELVTWAQRAPPCLLPAQLRGLAEQAGAGVGKVKGRGAMSAPGSSSARYPKDPETAPRPPPQLTSSSPTGAAAAADTPVDPSTLPWSWENFKAVLMPLRNSSGSSSGRAATARGGGSSSSRGSSGPPSSSSRPFPYSPPHGGVASARSSRMVGPGPATAATAREPDMFAPISSEGQQLVGSLFKWSLLLVTIPLAGAWCVCGGGGRGGRGGRGRGTTCGWLPVQVELLPDGPPG